MNILDASRYAVMKQALEGYQQTGISLVTFDGKSINPLPPLDDIGIYVLIPKIATFFHLTLDHAIYLFFWGLFLISFCSGFTAIFYLFFSFPARIVACFQLFLFAFFIFNSLSLYSLYTFIIIGILPWLIYLSQKDTNSKKRFFGGFIIGKLCSLSHFLRGFAWLPLMTFMILVITRQKNVIKKLVMAFCFLCGSFLPLIYFNSVFERYENFIKQELNIEVAGYKNHAFWHTLYCGLGFLKFFNDQNIKWSDDCAAQKVKELNSDVSDIPIYESTLRNEILNLAKTRSTFIINTIFGKLGILLLIFLLGVHVGLIGVFLAPKKFTIELCFVICFCISAFFPLISIPVLNYSMSLLATSACYSMLCLGWWLESLQKLVSGSTVRSL